MTFEDALSLDKQGDLAGASLAYEACLAEDPSRIGVLVNLIVLYWQATDFGFSTGHNLTADFVQRCSRRLEELLISQPKETEFSAEFMFWKKYIAWADLGEELLVEDCRRILRADPDYFEPAMYIFSVTEGRECAEEAETLLRICSSQATIRAQYVASVIRGTILRSTAAGRGP